MTPAKTALLASLASTAVTIDEVYCEGITEFLSMMSMRPRRWVASLNYYDRWLTPKMRSQCACAVILPNSSAGIGA